MKLSTPSWRTMASWRVVSLMANLFAFAQLVNCQSVVFPDSSQSQQQASNPPPNPRVNLNRADENGIYLVGLFDLHKASSRGPLKCGPIDLDAGEMHSHRSMQNLEAFLWAIDQINADSSVLPGVKLGSVVIDTCSSLLGSSQQLANILQDQDPSSTATSGMPHSRQIAAIIADQSDPQLVEASVSIASGLNLVSFVTQSRSSKLNELIRRVKQSTSRSNHQQQAQVRAGMNQARQYEDLMSELLGLGIGRMMTSPFNGEKSSHPDSPSQSSSDFTSRLHLMSDHHIMMIKTLLSNEILADALASFAQRMKWDLVSVIYDQDEFDMIDLHEEFRRELLSRNLQVALDEQVPRSDAAMSSAASKASVTAEYEKLIKDLVSHANYGSRVVFTMLGTGSSRLLLETLKNMRNSLGPDFSRQLNQLVWITTSDREPYYAYAIDALGTIGVSSSISLLPEFKEHFENIENNSTQRRRNRWWSEYLDAILMQSPVGDFKSMASQCQQQQVANPIVAERCKRLSLSSLISFGDKQQSSRRSVRAGSSGARFSKYLASGWEHNGMETINSVISVANGLESVRQAICPEQTSGLCPRMRALLNQQVADDLLAGSGHHLDAFEPPTISEILFSELSRSTFPLADGRMFNLLIDNEALIGSSGKQMTPTMSSLNLGSQVEAKLNFYNLRYVRQNSIGFVKFGAFDVIEGLSLNLSKACYYPFGRPGPLSEGGQLIHEIPLEEVRSSCVDETKCLMLSSYQASLNKQTISEEELAQSVNNLFKLDHPFMTGTSSHHPAPTETNVTESKSSSPSEELPPRQTIGTSSVESKSTIAAHPPFGDGIKIIKSLPPVGSMDGFGSPEDGQQQQQQQNASLAVMKFNIIALLPIHKSSSTSSSSSGSNNGDCSAEMNLESGSFGQLAALAFAQTMSNADSQSQIQLTTTVIDYCEQAGLARSRLASYLQDVSRLSNSDEIARPVAILDFDSKVSQEVDSLLSGSTRQSKLQLKNRDELLHLTIDDSIESANGHSNSIYHTSPDKSRENHLKISLMPSKRDEIKALLKTSESIFGDAMKVVHLIYTDHHEYKDEFIRRANEANICVFKLIWIPPEGHLEKTRRLFEQQFVNATSDKESSPMDQSSKSARIIFLLASTNVQINRMISEAATHAMLTNYIWITSHEWLASRIEASREPKMIVATQHETSDQDSQKFHQFYSKLSPSLHAPIPTDWFDEFWQQHFRCNLPISNVIQVASLVNEPTCKPIQHLQADNQLKLNQIDEDRIYYVIRAIESLQATLAAPSSNSSSSTASDIGRELSQKFRQNFDLLAPIATSPDEMIEEKLSTLRGLAHLPRGFQIVHRLLPESGGSPPPPASAAASDDSRRQNSRKFNAFDGELVKIGLWRRGKLAMLHHKANKQPASGRSLTLADQNMTATILTDADEEADDARSEQQMMMQAIVKSLQVLESVKSQCRASNICNACHEQIESTKALIRQETAHQELAFGSNSEPKALSPLEESINRQQRANRARISVASSGERVSPGDEIEASASSLFDVRTINQIDKSDSRRVYTGHIAAATSPAMGASQSLTIPSTGASGFGGGQTSWLKLNSAPMMSILSLVGVICIATSMTYLYPSMLDKSKLDVMDSVHQSQWSMFSAGRPKVDYPSSAHDYFLLTGLLMLYSINVAYVLPATMMVCWFRRIGLAMSYTVIISSILVKVLKCRKQQANYRKRSSLLHAGNLKSSSKKYNSGNSNPMDANRHKLSSPSVVGPTIDENVEVTFESLPHQHMQDIDDSQRVAHSTIDHRLAGPPEYVGYQSSSAHSIASYCEDPQTAIDTQSTGGAGYSLSLSLIMVQLFVSIVWLYRQPPEPTLYLTCWYCSSPSRSPVMFLYESPLSLLFPGLILMFAWIYSVLTFRVASFNDEQAREAANHRTTLGQQTKQPSQLKDSKSLVITTTLLIVTWSLVTLHTISNSKTKVTLPISAGFIGSQHPSMSQIDATNRRDDPSLVYANLISGAIIFVFLFIYRLNLTAYLIKSKSSKQSMSVIQMQSPIGSSSMSHSSDARTRKDQLKPTKEGSKLHRRESSGSVASSTTKLVHDNYSIEGDDLFFQDNISCASSVASSSASQLHGNDLYPIDCSIQLETQLGDSNSSPGKLARSNSFGRRSTRRSIRSKLSSVREENAGER